MERAGILLSIEASTSLDKEGQHLVCCLSCWVILSQPWLASSKEFMETIKLLKRLQTSPESWGKMVENCFTPPKILDHLERPYHDPLEQRFLTCGSVPCGRGMNGVLLEL